MVQKRHIHKLPAKLLGEKFGSSWSCECDSVLAIVLEPSWEIICTSGVEGIAYRRHNVGFAKSRSHTSFSGI